MKLRCPNCRKEFDLDAATNNDAILEILKMQAVFAPHSLIVLEYMELFKAVRPLKPAKLLRLLKEVRVLFVEGWFGYQRTRYTISKRGAAEALKIVCNKDFAGGLENHNYFKKVMIGIAEKEAEQRSIEAEKSLRKKEVASMSRSRGIEDMPPSEKGPEHVGRILKDLNGGNE